MITLIKNWKGEVDVNDTHYETAERAISDFKRTSDSVHIILHSAVKKASVTKIEAPERITEYRITVKAYMTREASPDFDFMARWNSNNPMPLRTMTGTIEKETRGMVYMNLRGEGFPTCTCMRCGRELTNPVSKLYGIGPECMSKLGIAREIDEVEAIKLGMRELKWSGWVIKSAIIKQEEI